MGGFFQEVVSGLLTLLVYSLMFAGVYKVFQIATDMGEIKELLRDIRRNSDHAPAIPAAVAQVHASQSPEDLMRALREQNYPLDYPSDTAEHSPAATGLNPPQ